MDMQLVEVEKPDEGNPVKVECVVKEEIMDEEVVEIEKPDQGNPVKVECVVKEEIMDEEVVEIEKLDEANSETAECLERECVEQAVFATLEQGNCNFELSDEPGEKGQPKKIIVGISISQVEKHLAEITKSNPVMLIGDEVVGIIEQETDENEESRPPSKEIVDVATDGTSASTPRAPETPRDSATGVENREDETSDELLYRRRLWISNVSRNTKASDIKQALSVHGRVSKAKVVVSARFPGSCRFGYVTMASVHDAEKVIEKMNNTELRGQIIKIEKFDEDNCAEYVIEPKLERAEQTHKIPRENQCSGEKRKLPSETVAPTATKIASVEEKSNPQKGQRDPPNDILTFDKIRAEREYQRVREKERSLREESRRREELTVRQKEIASKQRSEAMRLESERKYLRLERESLEKEKAKAILLERNRLRSELEILKQDREELRRLKAEKARKEIERPTSDRRGRGDGGGRKITRFDSYTPRHRSGSSERRNSERESFQKKYNSDTKHYKPYPSKNDNYLDKRNHSNFQEKRPVQTSATVSRPDSYLAHFRPAEGASYASSNFPSRELDRIPHNPHSRYAASESVGSSLSRVCPVAVPSGSGYDQSSSGGYFNYSNPYQFPPPSSNVPADGGYPMEPSSSSNQWDNYYGSGIPNQLGSNLDFVDFSRPPPTFDYTLPSTRFF